MAVKKYKSNWYIYAASFLVAALIAALFLRSMWDTFFPPASQTVYQGGVTTSLPDASNNMTALVMLSQYTGGAPDFYMIINYRPGDETIVCVPIKAATQVAVGNMNGSLTEAYNNGGVASVLYAIESTLGVKCETYAKFDKNAFIELLSETGAITVNTPYDITDSDGNVTFAAGSESLQSDKLYEYIYSQTVTVENDFQSVVLGSVAVTLFNSNLRGLSSTVFQSLASKIINNADTNYTFDDYTSRQQAFLFTSENSLNPAQYYIPYGEYNEAGNFVVAENSITTLKDRLAIEN